LTKKEKIRKTVKEYLRSKYTAPNNKTAKLVILPLTEEYDTPEVL
jgi:hypothetical protein